MSTGIRDKALQNADGDALDSIIAAYSVFRAKNVLGHQNTLCELYISEGFTFM
jgi:hypothetical protein